MGLDADFAAKVIWAPLPSGASRRLSAGLLQAPGRP